MKENAELEWIFFFGLLNLVSLVTLRGEDSLLFSFKLRTVYILKKIKINVKYILKYRFNHPNIEKKNTQ
jgi:hypothetical protein